MDDRLSKALSFSNYRKTVENRRIALQRRFSTMLKIHYKNGLFSVTNELISFVQTLITTGHVASIIIDDKTNPIRIDDLNEFLDTIIKTYTTASEEYMREMDKLSTARNIKSVVEWMDDIDHTD